MGVEPKIGEFTPRNGWFIMVPNPMKMDDLGGKKPYFWKHPYIQVHRPHHKVVALNLKCLSIFDPGERKLRARVVHPAYGTVNQ